MGGSSLAPEVFQRTFGNSSGYPELMVLDSTHPAAVRAVEARLDLARSLFIVSSKSGTTTEMLSFYQYFWRQVAHGTQAPGRQFIAITDPGTPLGALARERAFRRVFLAPPDVGGRYSALTVFGLVPAALIGVDVRGLLDRARRMAEACGSVVASHENPGLSLGAALGQFALAGCDKVTFVVSPSLDALPAWLEQLIAESTGKDGRGIVPVAEEVLAGPEVYSNDRVFVHLRLGGQKQSDANANLAAAENAGHPVIRIQLAEKLDLGQEFFRWEVAVAAAGAVLGIHPFNQPDVELAKQLARKAMAKKGSEQKDAAQTISVAQPAELRKAVSSWLGNARPGDYIALQAYLAPSPETTGRLQDLRHRLRERPRLATTLGYGPRFLHSTGQLHKGGQNTGLFLQLVDEPTSDLPVPETDYTFGALIQAQALGDYQALKQRGRRVLRVQLGGDTARGLLHLSAVLDGL
jgi:transaldolase/glucose-6-phosphate isomerase